MSLVWKHGLNSGKMTENERTTLLVVDDEPDILKGTARILRDAGYVVSEASSGAACLQAVKSEHPDLILLDVVMPDMEGTEVCRRIKADPECEGTFVILTSGLRVSSDEQTDGLLEGADGYIPRPLPRREFLARVEALARIHRTESALRQSENRFRALIDSSVDHLFMVDRGGLYLMSNDRVEHFGIQRGADLVGRSLYETSTPELAQIYRNNLAKVYAEGAPVTFEHTTPGQDGVHIHEDTFYPIGADGEVRFVGGIRRDVTEQRRLATQLRQAQRMESLGQLADGIAHDFNNNLTPIMMIANMLLEDIPRSEPKHEMVLDIKNAAERLANLTHQLLAYTRSQMLDMKPVSLNELIRSLMSMLQRILRANIQLVTRFGSGLDLVRADPGQLEQVLVNLAVNGMDAMPDGGTLTFETSLDTVGAEEIADHICEAPGKYVRLTVADTGTGMDPGIMERIFEPFFTTKPRGRGTGLGLSSVYGIVAQSGGAIDVRSEIGRGTVFDIFLPQLEAPASIQDDQDVRSTEQLAGKETVLVVDDEPTVRTLIVRFLAPFGYLLIQAASGEEALLVSSGYDGKIDLLVTDVVLEGMNGRLLADKLLAGRPELKVLYMSGYTRSVIGSGETLHPEINFVQKPFTARELARRIRQVLASTGEKPNE